MTLHSSQMGHGGHRANRRERLLSGPVGQAGAADQDGAETRHRVGSAPETPLGILWRGRIPPDPASADRLGAATRAQRGSVGEGRAGSHRRSCGTAYRRFRNGSGREDLPGMGSWADRKPGQLVLLAAAAAGKFLGRRELQRAPAQDERLPRPLPRLALGGSLLVSIAATEVATGMHRELQQAMISLVHTRLVGDGGMVARTGDSLRRGHGGAAAVRYCASRLSSTGVT